MILLRCLRPDRVINAVLTFVASVNPNFVKNVDVSMKDIYSESKCNVPVIFILSAGTDPTTHLSHFAKE